MKGLVIEGVLNVYDGSQHGTHNIVELQFLDTKIGSKCVLSLLSNDFPHVKSLTFDACTFTRYKNNIDIFMKNTGVGTLDIKHFIDNDDDIIRGLLLLVSVRSDDQSISNYFMNVLKHPKANVDEDDDGNGAGMMKLVKMRTIMKTAMVKISMMKHKKWSRSVKQDLKI